MSNSEVRFGPFCLDLKKRELLHEGNHVKLSNRALDILCLLVSANGALVTKDEILAHVWPDVVVAESNIQVHVSALRKALDQDQAGQTYVVTVPRRGYRFINLERALPNGGGADETPKSVALNKPSIAVLPFTNMSGELQQEHFADGLVEDLITALSRFRWLDVAARNSCFSFKGQSLPIREIVEVLGVDYLVEGSVRSSATQLRVTMQLIDASKDKHIWAETYDRQPGDLFDLQDEITATIIGVLVPALGAAERERSLRSNRPKLGAWTSYQRALAHYHRPYSAEDNLEARRLFSLAIEQDPAFADAHAMLALMGVYAVHSGQSTYTESREEILANARCLAQKAVQLDDSNALGHTALGRVNDMLGNTENAVAECQTAVKLNPNFALAQFELGMVLKRAERFEEAVQHLNEAIRLSPNDPARWNFYLIKGRALFCLGRYEEAVQVAKESSRLRPDAFFPGLVMASAEVEMNRMADAAVSVSYILERRPDMTCGLLQRLFGSNIKDADILIENCRKAGLPD